MTSSSIRLAVCETPAELRPGDAGWEALTARCRELEPDVVLLSEMPFGRWPADAPERDEEELAELRRLHDEGIGRLDELGGPVVLSSRPWRDGAGRSVNEGFAWSVEDGLRPVHTKQFLPEEPGYWETRWWERGETHFRVARVPIPARTAARREAGTARQDRAGEGTGRARADAAIGRVGEARALDVGFLICTEVMFNEWARHYGRSGAHLIVVPRATPPGTEGRWKTACAMAAVVSGCWVASSNRAGEDGRGNAFAGGGWIFAPSGELVAETSGAEPVVALELDPAVVEAAQGDYPCYVEDLPGGARPHPTG